MKLLRPTINILYFNCNPLCALARRSSTVKLKPQKTRSVDALPELTNNIKLEIETKWKPEVAAGTFDVKNEFTDKKYILSMFPYPSGNLHMGHVRVYTIGDTMAWYFRLNGKNVLHPIGFDAFGLPAENAAIERNIAADEWTWSNIKTMRKQLKDIGFSFDWDRELITCSPPYYKFTQFIFLQMYKEGLVYQKEALVNWDPVDQTVLADEQVDENGISWRSGVVVEKKMLKQWFIETTKFAKALKSGLNSSYLDDWRDIKNLQSHWIGECKGSSFNFVILDNKVPSSSVKIWTSYPEFMTNCSFVAVARNSQLNLKYSSIDGRLNIDLVNPINNEVLPVIITDEIEYDEGCDIKLVIPHLERQCEGIAKKFNLNWDSREIAENIVERNRVCELAVSAGIGGNLTSSKLKDWLISRQRKWGTPIPLIHCPNCGTVPVPFECLPVVLPPANDYHKWSSIDCPKCNQSAVREKDTMDTFVDSSWYFLRYLDPTNDEVPYSVKLSDRFMPVDLYVGGKEHAVLHLYYARFLSHFLHSIGMLNKPEPFKKLLVQGMVLGKTFQVKETGKYLPEVEVKESNGSLTEKSTGKKVIQIWEKMSKSKYNGVEPSEILQQYGIDTTRLFILCDVSPTSNKFWKSDTFPGILKWQNRIWALMADFLDSRRTPVKPINTEKVEEQLWDARNYYTKSVTFNYGTSHQLSVAISKLQGFTNSMKKCPKPAMGQSSEFELSFASFIVMLAPMAPHFASELWSHLQNAPSRINKNNRCIRWDKNVLKQNWPKLDEAYNLTLLISVNNAVKDSFKMPYSDFRDLSSEKASKLAFTSIKVKQFIAQCDILETNLTIIPDFEATFNIEINHLQKNKNNLKSSVT